MTGFPLLDDCLASACESNKPTDRRTPGLASLPPPGRNGSLIVHASLFKMVLVQPMVQLPPPHMTRRLRSRSVPNLEAQFRPQNTPRHRPREPRWTVISPTPQQPIHLAQSIPSSFGMWGASTTPMLYPHREQRT